MKITLAIHYIISTKKSNFTLKIYYDIEENIIKTTRHYQKKNRKLPQITNIQKLKITTKLLYKINKNFKNYLIQYNIEKKTQNIEK